MNRMCPATRRTFLASTAAASATVVFGVPLLLRGAAKATLRIATLAPDGSSWDRAFKETARDAKAQTGGAVDMKIYSGGTMGDESAMIRKCRTGQLDGAAVTSVGLGDINKQLLMLQLPLLFKKYEEVDRVRTAMSAKFEALLHDGGFTLGDWGDVGFVYIFSNRPIGLPSDIKSTKPWVWDADPVSKKVMEVVGANGVPLGVPDVLPSLQTGLVDAFTNSPYGAIALQWYTKARYVTNLKLSMGVGASVLTLKAWEKIPDDAKAILQSVTHSAHGKLLKQIRRDNAKAIATLVEKGIKVVEPGSFDAWSEVATRVRKGLTGTVFEAALVDEMLGHIKGA